MTTTSHDITVLNGLIKTTLDSRKGYREAAESVTSPTFSEMFTEFALDRGTVATQLQAEVTRLGGEPEDDSGLLAAAHRAFMNLRDAITGRDDKAIIEEVERGEDFIKGKFEAALKDTALAPATLTAITQAYVSVRNGHDRVSALKRQMA